ncbi:porin [Sphingomonas sp. BN140010]|uniref:Porin n=1 Tax=Sphingomonas arvum TaxID=2992113 RepID=A0ABT3JF68_9SPHN|nr:porin [Sphingomonas sp. BN140010]MCW3797722.1 porin [Sphingomonas sp. BN140010]
MNWGVNSKRNAAVALAAASLLLPASVVIAAPAAKSGKPPAVAVSFERSFTPAQADPRLAAALASRPALASDFGFTPAAAKRRPSQVRVAVRARANTPVQAALQARDVATHPVSEGVSLAPASYNLGVAVGWRRFAVTGDVAKAKAETPALGSREGATVGVNYNLSRFTGRVAASADRTDRQVAALASSNSYALDVGGAYNISNRVAVTGGVRYRIEREKLATFSDQRRDSQAVYIGTAFKF